jgi:hypothetical protein
MRLLLQKNPEIRRLLDAHAGDGTGDNQLLDLFGAFEDVVDPLRLSTQ